MLFKSFENNFRLFKVANACKLSLMIDDGGGEGKGERTYPPPPSLNNSKLTTS